MNGGNVIFDFKGDTNDLTQKTKTLGSKVGSVASGIASGFAIATAAVASAATAVLGFGVKFNNEIEQYNTAFATLTGSSQRAIEMTQYLKKFAAATPFELSDLAKGAQTLMAFGISADDTAKYVKVLGDVSMGNADRFQSLSLAFGQMSSTGKLMGQDLLQMVNAGFNPLQQISEKTGESMASLKEKMSQGKISVEMVQQAFMEATQEGGRFYGAMEAQSKTFNGQMATLKDNAKSLAGALAGGLTDSLKSNVLPTINEIIQGLQTAFETGGIEAFSKKLGESLVKGLTMLTSSLPKITDVAIQVIKSLVESLITNAPQLMEGIVAIVSSLITGLTSLLPTILDAGLKLAINLAIGLAKAFPTMIPTIIKSILGLIPVLLDNLPLLIDAGIQLMLGLITGIVDSIPVLMEMLPQIIDSLIQGLMKAIPQIIMMAPQMIWALVSGLIKAIPSILKATPQIIVAIVKGLKEGFKDMVSIGNNLVKGLWQGIDDTIDWVLGKIKGFGKSVLKGIKSIFGIKSPSKEMFKIGGYIDEGFINGINSMESDVMKSFNGIFDLSPQLYGTANQHLSPNITVINNNNIKQDALGQMVNDVKTYSGGSKNSYNYGGVGQ